ncbi:MAG TPA: hypothetical protein VND89_10025 [Acidimicrobiales bacterium]|nr:hypothetical protein [Acidimicrobiales bacterium]
MNRNTLSIVALAILLSGLIWTPLPAGAQVTVNAARSNGRFTQSFTLDNGAMKVRPAPKSMKPERTQSEAATEIWATSGVVSTQRRFVGFGLATIIIRVKGVPVVKNLPAWIGVTYSTDVQACTAMTGPPKKLTPPHSDGYAAVILGDRLDSPAIVYTAAADVCDKYRPASVQDALEMWSVPWTYVRPGVVAAHYPSCAKWYSTAGGFSPTSGLTITEFVTQAEDPAEMPSGYCQPAHTFVDDSSQVAGVTLATHHDTTGPREQVTS